MSADKSDPATTGGRSVWPIVLGLIAIVAIIVYLATQVEDEPAPATEGTAPAAMGTIAEDARQRALKESVDLVQPPTDPALTEPEIVEGDTTTEDE